MITRKISQNRKRLIIAQQTNPLPLQFTEHDFTLDTTYTLTIELTDINGKPTGISDQITFTVKETTKTPDTPPSKKSGGQLQFSDLLLLLLWLLGYRFHRVDTRSRATKPSPFKS